LTLTNGLVGYRSFDSNDGDDESGNGRHGTLSGGVSFTGGKVGRAGQFDGVNDAIVLPSTITLGNS